MAEKKTAAKREPKPKGQLNVRQGVLQSYRPHVTEVEAIQGPDPKDINAVASVVGTLMQAGVISGYGMTGTGLTLQVVGQRGVRLGKGQWLVVADGRVSVRHHDWFAANYDTGETPVRAKSAPVADESGDVKADPGIPDVHPEPSPVVTT